MTVTAFPQLECVSARWWALVPFAIAAATSWALVYAIFLVGAVWHTAISRRRSGGVRRGCLGFVTRHFRDTTYFWILVESLTDLFLIMSPAFLDDGATQLILC